MEAKYLLKDELEFELRLKGVDFSALRVGEMKERLQPLLAEEATKGVVVTDASFVFAYATEFPLIKVKYMELLVTLTKFQDPGARYICKQLNSRIHHLLRRVNVAPIENVTAEDLGIRSEWVYKASELFSALDRAVALRRQLSGRRLNSSLLAETANGGDGENGEDEEAEEEETDDDAPPNTSTLWQESVLRRSSVVPPVVVPQFVPVPAPPRSTVVPVHKWGLKFNGESRDMTVTAFLERVDELRVARGVAERDLFRSAADLFEGKVLNWFRTVRDRCHTWSDLSKLLQQHYLPPDYKARLFDEILSRTQGPNEKIIEYLSSMTTLFNRHGDIAESVRLSIVSRNLAPFYTEQLPEVQSISELEIECLKLEVKKHRVDNYRPPTRRPRDCVEPSLAYVEPVSSVATVYSSKQRTCFNCHKAGHFVRDCQEPRSLKCFKCKAPGFTVNTCPKCKNQGNARAGHSRSGQ